MLILLAAVILCPKPTYSAIGAGKSMLNIWPLKSFECREYSSSSSSSSTSSSIVLLEPYIQYKE